MKTIKVLNTGIEIKVNTCEELYSIYFHLHSYYELSIDNEILDCKIMYTKGYFEHKYFNNK